jgi:hypothetical protein
MTIFKIDVYSGANTKKDNSIDIIEDVKSIDPLILSLIQQIFICNNVYINKCKSSRGKFINSFLINGDLKKNNSNSLKRNTSAQTWKKLRTRSSNIQQQLSRNPNHLQIKRHKL